MTTARWSADDAVRRLEAFQQQDALHEQVHLVRSYFYSALIYTVIGEQFENFVFSDRQEAEEPIGAENMHEVFDQALERLNQADELAGQIGREDWRNRIAALKARTAYSRAVRQKLSPQVQTGDPFVDDDQVADLARQALDRTGPAQDWQYWLQVGPETVSSDLAYQVNERRELRVGETFLDPGGEGSLGERIQREDPIDEVASPELDQHLQRFFGDGQYHDVPVISNRELHLIAAEAGLAGGDDDRFRQHINALRAYDKLSEYQGQVGGCRTAAAVQPLGEPVSAGAPAGGSVPLRRTGA